MKQIYLLFALFLLANTANSQIITFPDPDFKTKLLLADIDMPIAFDQNLAQIKIDSNADGEIQLTEALSVYMLDVQIGDITDITGIEYFTNLVNLQMQFNYLTNTVVDFSALTNLQILNCRACNISSLNVLQCVNLVDLHCGYNEISNLDLTGLSNLELVSCLNNNTLTTLTMQGCSSVTALNTSYCSLTALDVSPCHNLITLDCESNFQLSTLNLKNGADEYLTTTFTDPLPYICQDDSQIAATQLLCPPCNINVYCSAVPGGNYYTINGSVGYDNDTNGCDAEDTTVLGTRFIITNGATSGTFISSSNGQYNLPLTAGNYTITPIVENQASFNVAPSSVNVTFPDQLSPLNQNFCISPIGVLQDLEITVLPTSVARPGFDAEYKIIYKNIGTNTASGYVELAFEDEYMDFISSTPGISGQSTDLLTWDYIDLQPFESREIQIVFNMNTPMEVPALNGGDDVGFASIIYPLLTDSNSYDNHSDLKQFVVNSFDPNDKTCIEGPTITPEMVGKFVHYIIRFENTGTFVAENIVVKDLIDMNKFDIATLIPVNASHSFITNITAGNKVEFVFEDINLPFDDANNDGFVAFKIKTLQSLVLGDTFSNTASIYFDYNYPIITDPAVTTVAIIGCC